MAALPLCDGDWSVDVGGELLCSGTVSQVDGAQADLWITGGWDADAFAEGFSGIILLFVAGLGVGLVVSMVRKLRSV